ncbi:MAG: ATP-dependent helicase [Gammaproteobacteria bacterium]|jgi:DNA helicase-2/ATP-dependent DNA helicase PcrA
MASGAVNGDYLEKLNPAQREAALHGRRTSDGFQSGPLLVIAGAGTGKTMTLAHRVAHLVLQGVDPNRILLLTFTRRAAREMTERARRIVSEAKAEAGHGRQDARISWSGTFHAVANRLLREYAANLRLDPSFTVLDRADSADLMDVVRHRLDLSGKSRRFPKKDTCLAIYSRCVNSGDSLDDCLQEIWPWCMDWQEDLRRLFRAYVEVKQDSASLDYDDLLLYWSQLMGVPELSASVSSRFDHILVDEYQDTNMLQAAILRALRPDGAGVTVVGDDAQSIYSFRAAEIENILGFPEAFTPRARVVTLERNYRSVQPVLDAANDVIARGSRQYRKTLFSQKPSDQKPRFVTVEDDEAQADYVVSRVLMAREEGQRLMDQAVLFRNSHHSDRLELELTRRNIPYVKYGGLKFLEAAHVKDLLAVLRWAENPRDQVAAFRVVQLLPGAGPVAAQRCFDHLAARDYALDSLGDYRPPPAARSDWPGLADLVSGLGPGIGDWQSQVAEVRGWYRQHLVRRFDDWQVREGDLDALEQIAAGFPTRERFLSELSLDPPQATGDYAGPPLMDEDFLVLSTVHSAKGQEWDSVYILNVADGNFPSEFATGRPELIEEERRLLYVAMTRAKSELHLLAPLRYFVPQQRRLGDRHVYGARSRFLPDSVMARFQKVFHGPGHSDGAGPPAASDTIVDAGARLREMW